MNYKLKLDMPTARGAYSQSCHESRMASKPATRRRRNYSRTRHTAGDEQTARAAYAVAGISGFAPVAGQSAPLFNKKQSRRRLLNRLQSNRDRPIKARHKQVSGK